MYGLCEPPPVLWIHRITDDRETHGVRETLRCALLMRRTERNDSGKDEALVRRDAAYDLTA